MEANATLIGWRPSLLRSTKVEAIATRLDAIATRVEAIATGLKAIDTRVEACGGHRY